MKAQSFHKRIIKLEEIEKHDSRESCWMAIEGQVYDVTGYIDQHPGGEHILKGCGRNMTSSFQDKRSRGIFDKKAEKELQKYHIGTFEE